MDIDLSQGSASQATPAPVPLQLTPAAPAAPDQAELRTKAWEKVLRELDAQAARPPASAKGFAEFELDFEQALMRQLGPFFEHLPALELTPDNIRRVVEEKARGAYYLLLNDRLVYIGKSDAKLGLQARLLRHYKTLKRRRNIDWAQMKFKAVKVASLAALDTESLLLRLHDLTGAASGTERRPEWNYSGFGSNDPGVRRDTQRVSIFDQKYPLDLDAVIDLDPEFPLPPGPVTLDKYIVWLRKQLKVTFRIQKNKVPRPSRLTAVTVDPSDMASSRVLRDLLRKVHQALPAGWLLTVLRGKVVLYVNDTREYLSPIWRLAPGVAEETPDYTLREVGSDGAIEHGPDEDGDDEDDEGNGDDA